jgi:hypothetical protein
MTTPAKNSSLSKRTAISAMFIPDQFCKYQSLDYVFILTGIPCSGQAFIAVF